MQDARRRLDKMKQFISSKYPAVARRLIKSISAHDLTNPAYHWYGSKTDFVYQDIHPDIIKAFLATKKVKRIVLPSSVEDRRRALQKNPNREDRIMSFDFVRFPGKGNLHVTHLHNRNEKNYCKL